MNRRQVLSLFAVAGIASVVAKVSPATAAREFHAGSPPKPPPPSWRKFGDMAIETHTRIDLWGCPTMFYARVSFDRPLVGREDWDYADLAPGDLTDAQLEAFREKFIERALKCFERVPTYWEEWK